MKHSPTYRWVVLAMAFLGVFGAIGFGRFGYSAILPSMQQALGLTSAAAGSLSSWNLIGYTIMAAIGGVLASRIGPRFVLTIGMVLSAAGMFVAGVSTGLGTASLGRLVTGMGNGMILVPAIALMPAWFPLKRVGFASTMVPAGSALAMVLAGPLVPRLVQSGGADGWRLAWYVFAGAAMFLAILNVALQRDRPRSPAAGRGALYGRRAADRHRHPATTGSDLLSILRSGYAWYLGFIYFLYGVGFSVYFTFFQKRLTTDVGYSPETAGTLFLVMGVAGLVGGLLFGVISDRIGRRWTLAIAMLMAGVASLLFAWAPHVAVIGLSAVLLGSTGLSLPGLYGAACGDRFGAALAAASLGFITMLVGVGQSVGPYVAGLLGDAFGSLAFAFVLSGAAFIIGAAGSLLLPEIKPGHHAYEEAAERRASAAATTD